LNTPPVEIHIGLWCSRSHIQCHVDLQRQPRVPCTITQRPQKQV